MACASQYELFPLDVSTASIPHLHLSQLLGGNGSESDAFFAACQDRGIFSIDLRDGHEGGNLLESAAAMFSLAERVFGLEDNEKMKYALDWKNTNG